MRRTLVIVLPLLLAVLPVIAQTVSPQIQLNNIPAWGDVNGVLTGQVSGLPPGNFRAAVFLFVEGLGFYSKPTCDFPTVPVLNGAFSADVTTGNVDAYATAFAVVILPESAQIPCATGATGIPEPIWQQSVATTLVPRPSQAQREIVFSGERWIVKSTALPGGGAYRAEPSTNYWCDSTDNAWVDGQSRLHLRTTYVNGHWCAVELISKRSFSYGQYAVRVASPPPADANVVFGAFTYANMERSTRELDVIEYWKDPDGFNAQTVVQPAKTAGNTERFSVSSATPLIHSMVWLPNSLRFQTATADQTIVHDWTYAGVPPVADSDRVNFRLNLWIRQPDVATSNQQPVEMVVDSFSYEPAGAGCAIQLGKSYVTATENGVYDQTTLQTGVSCVWTARANGTWVQVFPLSGTGPGSMYSDIMPNFRTTARISSVDLGTALLTVDQAAGIGTELRRYIRLLYFVFLGRLPSEADVNFQSASGLTRAQLALNLFNSDEFALGGRFVAGLYRGILNREAEYGGWLFQRNAVLRGNISPTALISNFINSAEFALGHPGINDDDFVRLLYNQILLRTPSDAEVAFQAGAVRTFGRAQITWNFLQSQEFRIGVGPRVTAFLLYATLLQRATTADEFTAALNALQGGTPLIALITPIVEGSELRQNLQ